MNAMCRYCLDPYLNKPIIKKIGMNTKMVIRYHQKKITNFVEQDNKIMGLFFFER